MLDGSWYRDIIDEIERISKVITSLVVVLILGAGVVYTISTWLLQKSKASVFAAIGCTLGIIAEENRNR